MEYRDPDGTLTYHCFSCGHDSGRGKEGSHEAEDMEGMIKLKDVPRLPIMPLECRGIGKEVAELYRVRAECNPETGEPEAFHFPLTTNGKSMSGTQRKVARGPGERQKSDTKRIGNTRDVLPFGAHLHGPGSGKMIVVTEGAEDCLAATEMLLAEGKKYRVVATLGTSGWQKNLEYFESFQRVLIAYDQSGDGLEAAEAFAEALTPGKGVIARWDGAHDPNDLLLEDSGSSTFLKALYDAKAYEPAGIIHGEKAWEIIKDYTEPESIPYPPEWEYLGNRLGGLRRGEISLWTAGCVDPDTEYHDGSGWRRIADYDGGPILTVDENGNAWHEVPSQFTRVPDEGLVHFRTKYGVDQCLSPGHRVVYENNHGALRVLPFHTVVERHHTSLNGWHGKFRTTFSFEGPGLPLSDAEVRLQVAVKADGRVVGEGKDNYTQMRFHKERKYARILTICREGGLRFKDNGFRNGQYEVIVWPTSGEKRYTPDWYQVSYHQLQIIADEALHWDGSKGKIFFSRHKEDADFIQWALTATGRRARVVWGHGVWDVVAAGNPLVGITNRHERVPMNPYQSPDGHQYCFTVSTGMWVMRRNGCIAVTGNTGIGKSSMVRRLKQHVIQNTNWKLGDVELEESAPKTIRSMMQFQARKMLTAMTPTEKRRAYEETYGTGRLFTLDHRSQYSKGQSLLGKLKHLRYGMECDILVVDHITLAQSEFGDGQEGLAQQDRMMSDFLQLAETTGVHVCLISHLRKGQSGSKSFEAGATPTLDDLKGSGSVKQISFDIIAVSRNSQHEDEYEKNVSQLHVLKCRETGNTGPCDRLFWDRDEQTLLPAREPEEEQDEPQF